MFDLASIRKDFPILRREIEGKRLVYLDSAATSQKPQQVIDALADYYKNYNANIHRGIHTLSEEATAAYEDVREIVRSFIKAGDSKEIIFTRNTTEAINLVASTWGKQNIKSGDEILLSPMEHHSNLVPWQMLALECGAKLVFAELTADGMLDLASIEKLLNKRTKLVALTQMSNVLGTIVPVAQVAKMAHAHGALLLVDGAQSVPHMSVSVKDLDCDFLVFSLHKMLGPTGVGILWSRAEILESMPPYMGGGDMISAVWRDRAIYNQLPWKFEAGTPNIADVIASGVAVEYLAKLGMDNVRAHEKEITEYAMKRLGEISEITIYGPRDSENKGGVVSFNLPGIHPHDLGQLLNEDGVAIRVGHHCCQPLMRDMNLMGTARASFYIYSATEEIDLLFDALVKAQKVLGHVACR